MESCFLTTDSREKAATTPAKRRRSTVEATTGEKACEGCVFEFATIRGSQGWIVAEVDTVTEKAGQVVTVEVGDDMYEFIAGAESNDVESDAVVTEALKAEEVVAPDNGGGIVKARAVGTDSTAVKRVAGRRAGTSSVELANAEASDTVDAVTGIVVGVNAASTKCRTKRSLLSSIYGDSEGSSTAPPFPPNKRTANILARAGGSDSETSPFLLLDVPNHDNAVVVESFGQNMSYEEMRWAERRVKCCTDGALSSATPIAVADTASASPTNLVATAPTSTTIASSADPVEVKVKWTGDMVSYFVFKIICLCFPIAFVLAYKPNYCYCHNLLLIKFIFWR
jgi:hypothetical protein